MTARANESEGRARATAKTQADQRSKTRRSSARSLAESRRGKSSRVRPGATVDPPSANCQLSDKRTLFVLPGVRHRAARTQSKEGISQGSETVYELLRLRTEAILEADLKSFGEVEGRGCGRRDGGPSSLLQMALFPPNVLPPSLLSANDNGSHEVLCRP